MPVDWSALVLSPCMNTYAVPISVLPVVSQPGQPAYAAQGIWTTVDVDVMLDDGSKLASSTLTLGIRLADFTVLPKKGDKISIVTPTGTDVYLTDMVRADGQGGAKLYLRSMQTETTNLNRYG